MPCLLNVNNYHYRRGGADIVHLEQSRLFTQLGWDVAEFAMEHPRNESSPWEDYFVEEIEFGETYSMREQAVRVGRVIYSRQAQQRLRQLLDAARPDIAHLHNIYHHLSPSILPVLAERQIPVVLTTHDLKLACPSYQMLSNGEICERCQGGRIHNVVRHRCIKGSRGLSTVVLAETALHRALRTFERCVDRFVTPSRFYRHKFVEWGWPADRFVHIPNYVDATQFRPATDAGAGFVYFGRLAPEKGLTTLVRAAAAAHVTLRLVGTGPEEGALRGLADELGVDVQFLGYRTGEELYDVVRSARATVLPSEWFENAPISVLESYALGVPVVGARIGGITELIRERETGWGFASGSVDDLASTLSMVAGLPDADVFEMGRSGRRWVEEEFGVDLHLERLLDLYETLGAPITDHRLQRERSIR